MDLRLIKCHGVNLSISREASHEVFHISIQNYVEAKLPDPVLWNFTWKNGSLFAFRCNQPGFLKMSCLATIKVLLVSLAFENRVSMWPCQPQSHSQTESESRESLLSRLLYKWPCQPVFVFVVTSIIHVTLSACILSCHWIYGQLDMTNQSLKKLKKKSPANIM